MSVLMKSITILVLQDDLLMEGMMVVIMEIKQVNMFSQMVAPQESEEVIRNGTKLRNVFPM